jgi:hypothetical protein
MDEVLKSFGENGPWALMAGFLLHQVIKAWTSDRAQLSGLLTEFREALAGLANAVDGLRYELESLSEREEK